MSRREPGCCYVCGRPIGVFTWTDRNGQAHPWCIESERPKWMAPVTGEQAPSPPTAKDPPA